MLTLMIHIVAALGVCAPTPDLAPSTPVPKRLDRMPDPAPELGNQLSRFDAEYRNGSDEKFAELEGLAEGLARRFPAKDDQARIWYEVAFVAGQSDIARQADRVKKYAERCLAISRDPLQRGSMWTLLACTVDLNGYAFPKGRREAAEILLAGYAEMLAQELPEEAPELPGVDLFDIVGDPIAEQRALAQHDAQTAARKNAEFIRDLVGRRNTLVMQLRDLFKPEPKQHGRNPEGPGELRALAKRTLTEGQVQVLLEKVMK